MTQSQPENKRKKMPDECLLTIKFRWNMTKQYSFHDDSDLRSWYLSPIAADVKDSLVVAYKDGCRIHFPLCNIESYHVAPRQMMDHCELSGDLSCPQPMTKPAARCELCTGRLNRKYHYAPSKVVTNAETPPAVHD